MPQPSPGQRTEARGLERPGGDESEPDHSVRRSGTPAKQIPQSPCPTSAGAANERVGELQKSCFSCLFRVEALSKLKKHQAPTSNIQRSANHQPPMQSPPQRF